MAKITLHPMIRRIQGKMGDVVFRLAHTGEMTVTKVPDMSHVKWSEAQKAHRQRFAQAVAYAKSAMSEPAVWAMYEERAAKEHKRAWDLAVSDHYHGNDRISIK